MSTRTTYFLGFIVICTLLLTSVYLQLFAGIMPCPLCTLQRLSFALLGMLFLIGIFLHAKRFGLLLINSLATCISVLGIFLAGRQIWLQHFPAANGTECGVSLQYMMQVLPLNQVVQKIFEGSAECSQRGWEFLHLNMAEWALLWFALFLMLSIYLFTRSRKKTDPRLRERSTRN
jgi:protein dithiol:quinone oxidoreductase